MIQKRNNGVLRLQALVVLRPGKFLPGVFSYLMNIFQSRLTQLEVRLQSLIEGSAARLFPGRGAPHHLTQHLLAAMQSAARPSADGYQVPNLYRLCLHPEAADALRQSPAFLAELANLLRQSALEAGLTLSGPLSVRVEPDLHLAPGEVRVLAFDSLQDLTPTHGLALPQPGVNEAAPAGAFLIVNGLTVFPLEQTVINIGRRPDNQLVIDDPRISRLHAQIRLVRGRYVLFDLDSTGGMFVNGLRVRQHILNPGDVISLAGVPLVYGQDGEERVITQKINTE